MKTEYVGTRQLANGRRVAEFDLSIAWWGLPFILLWHIFHPREAAWHASQEECDGLAVRNVKFGRGR